MKNQKPTIKNISEQTGFSVSTVSRVLNGYGKKYRISTNTQKIIKAKAEELNFYPNQIARGLRLNKTCTIGLIVPDISNPFFSSIARIITQKARLNKQTIILLDSEENKELEKECIEVLRSRNTDGIILFPTSTKNDFIESVYKEGLPVVLVDRYLYNSEIPYVSSDNYRGAYDATRHFLNNGHKNLVCIQGNTESSPNIERVKGYKKAFADFNLATDNLQIVGNGYSERNGYDETKKLLQNRYENKITSIFTLSNVIALGAIKAIREANLSIPEDISILTFDGEEFLSVISPPISCVEQSKNEIGKKAIELLLNQINKEDITNKKVQLPTKLIIRESVKKLRK